MQPQIRDIKPLVAVPLGPPWELVAAAAVALLVLVVLGIWWWRRARRPKIVAPPPAESPDVTALRALTALAGWSVPDREAARRLAYQLSLVLRAYVEARFGLNATDLTTEEITASASAVPGLGDASAEVLRRVLGGADVVKYAPAEAVATECTALIHEARGFVLRHGPAPAARGDAA